MRKTSITLALMFYALPALSAVDVSALQQATTVEELSAAYQSAANKIIDDATVDDAEKTSAREQVSANIAATKNINTTDNTQTPTLTSQQQQEKIKELSDNASAMRAKETSVASRTVGAASIGATGVGAGMAAGALSEQASDNQAEQQMRAYLATFQCKYGNSPSVKGGTVEITLPGGNDLIPLYSEYVTLANQLKQTKSALGLRAGIESQSILDSATSGLYDDVGVGVNGGAYASLSRALADPTGTDAAAWNAQRAQTAEQLQTGAITAGAGALAGLIGNIAISATGKQESSTAIQAKYAAMEKLQEKVEKLPENDKSAKCPSGATGTYPNCACTNSKYVYNANTNACDECSGDKVAVDGICACPSGKQPGENDTCIVPTQKPTCDTTDLNIVVDADGICTCKNGFRLTDNGQNCKCPDTTHTIKDGQCVSATQPILTPTQTVQTPAAPVVQLPQMTTILSAKNLFATNSARLTPAAQTAVAEFAAEVLNASEPNAQYCITVKGHTDQTGNDAINNRLSKQRAESVSAVLISAGLSPNVIVATGHGSVECELPGRQESCRKVELTYTPAACNLGITGSNAS